MKTYGLCSFGRISGVNRLFTFGCSFTQYFWPTWADIVANCFEYSENWGRPGAGNFYIYNALIECNIRNKITADDTVAIMWTNVSREDRYRNGAWVVAGNIYTQNTHPKKWVKYWADTRGYYIRDLSLIYSTKKLLESIGCKFYFMSMVDINNAGQYKVVDSEVDNLLEHYKETISIFRPSVHKEIFNYDWESRPLATDRNFLKLQKKWKNVAGPDWPNFSSFVDGSYKNTTNPSIIEEILDVKRWGDWNNVGRFDLHPIPGEHLLYLNKVLPEYAISEETKLAVAEADKLVITNSDNYYQDLTQETIQHKLFKNFRANRAIKRW